MANIVIRNAQIVNEGTIRTQDLHIQDGIIKKIAPSLEVLGNIRELDAQGNYLIPGIIDDQVHFREPGLTHKATIQTEARAAVAGGVTSFMEMPNTSPATLTQTLLEEKYAIASRTSLANYSFFMGASNDNLDEVLRTPADKVCGIKVFMGSSTGNMLVDNQNTLDALFSSTPMLIATHCEDERTIRDNMVRYQSMGADNLDAAFHPKIRSVKACALSSSMAISLAQKHNTRLHILHISTAPETDFFRNDIPLSQKRITSEVCVHHLSFNSGDYARLGNLIKCNPAIKAKSHQDALWKALLDNRLDIIATDHAPHTSEEKSKPYLQAPAGLPLVQHSLPMMLKHFHRGAISLERIVEKMCHAPAEVFRLHHRGYIREGYAADLALVDIHKNWKVTKKNILHKCGWSPLEGTTLKGQVIATVVSGHLAYHNGVFDESKMGERLMFGE